MFTEFPRELKFAFNPEGAIYLPEANVPIEVRGHGHIVFTFKPTRTPQVMAVGLKEVHWRFNPFAIPLDVDGDGQPEYIEINDLEVLTSFFDLRKSTGTLNLESGEFRMNWEYVISAKQFPMLERYGPIVLRFTKQDCGRMNFDDWSFELHCGVLQVSEGLLAGARFRGGGTGEIYIYPSDLDLYIAVATPGTATCTLKTKQVIICPGEKVLLCWSASSDVTQVDITPGLKGQNISGTKVVYPPTPSSTNPPEVNYRAVAVGGNNKLLNIAAAESSVTVVFYRGEWLGPFEATPDAEKVKWSYYLDPRTYAGSIEASEIRLVTKGCLNWDAFFVEHIPASPPYGPGGSANYSASIQGTKEVQVKPFRAAGTWNFYSEPSRGQAGPDAAKVSDRVCFQFRGKCRPL